jgi:hypothetical protein
MYPLIAVVGFLAAGVVEPIYALAPKLNQFLWLLAGIGAAASARVLAGAEALARDEIAGPADRDVGTVPDDIGEELSPLSTR